MAGVVLAPPQGIGLLRPTRPILKWAGGKTQLLPELRRAFPGSFNRYAEPFLGGGAMLFDLARPGSLAADSNPDLIELYQVVRDDPQALLAAVNAMPVSSDDYYIIRALSPETLCPIERAARFVYLNKTCYNGLHRVNRRGQFNTPYGGRSNVTIVEATSLLRASDVLRHTELQCADYISVLASLSSGDFVYLDPPYVPVSVYSDFRRYTSSFFGEVQHEELAKQFHLLAERGVRALLSNSATEKVLSLYDGYPMRRVRATRQINCKAERRGSIEELLIANYPLD